MVKRYTPERPCHPLKHSISLAPSIIRDLLVVSPDVTAVCVDYIRNGIGTFVAAVPITLWGGEAPTRIPFFEIPHAGQMILNDMISYPGNSSLSHMPPMQLFGLSYPEETRLSVFFFRGMTIVGTSHIEALLEEGNGWADFAGRLGSIYTVLPESGHARLSRLQTLREKMVYHDRILRLLCGDSFASTLKMTSTFSVIPGHST